MASLSLSVLLLLCGIVTIFQAFQVDKLDLPGSDAEWETWKKFHGKTYENPYVETYRKAIWQANLEHIKEHNNGKAKFKLAMNQLGDLTPMEYRSLMLGAKHRRNSMKRSGSTFLAPTDVELPEFVDWRTKGYVTPVKNQGQCGSCWAFSTTGSLEGQHFKKTGNLVSLSEQNLVDCTEKYGNEGCKGGWMDNAFDYIKANGGIDTEATYPYYSRDLGYCYFRASGVGATVTGHVDITKFSEQDLQVAVATVGPVSVAIDAGHVSFQLYHGGVYYEPSCNSTKLGLDHAVLVVGYGNYNGEDYWLVKNSWGESWGLNGYIMMARNQNNNCGIATAASYPLV
ncbi:procathepsin L-like [Xenia sp. Carnegie-2017]|uniref:procathepsin L-like n=1 Tax=Xenia sp. Carnegie-2017 TaxID=2897299 RepID=UPI001F04C94D|nr:procathepsin L-like [Xenia sp. Carnegie-2017]